MTRLLMSFRADEVAPGDYVALPFGPAEVISTERMIGDKGVVIEITARIDKSVDVGSGEIAVTSELVVFRPAPHEFVNLWETR